MKLVVICLFLSSFPVFADFNITNSKFEFTGYKFTQKTGVKGTFKDIQWKYNKKAKTPIALLKSGKIKIDSFSIDSGDLIRNKNITTALFMNWGARRIHAKVLSVDEKNNELLIRLKIGKSINKVKMSYEISEKTISITGSVDLLQLGFNSAFQKLVDTCKVLHTGKDGVPKTWSTVDFNISGDLIN